jgi:predicted Zn-ribbon and HTH transcriptional regulator
MSEQHTPGPAVSPADDYFIDHSMGSPHSRCPECASTDLDGHVSTRVSIGWTFCLDCGHSWNDERIAKATGSAS